MASSSSSSTSSNNGGLDQSKSFAIDIISNSNCYTLKPLSIKIKAKKLTQQGLDMCTEVLGSENMARGLHGSDVDVVVDHGYEKKIKERLWTSRIAPRMSLPPPMRSLVGGNAVRVTRGIEDGNFVLKATINRPSSSSILVAERISGNGAESPRLVLKYHYVDPSQTQEEVEVEVEEEYFDAEEKDEEEEYEDDESVILMEIMEEEEKKIVAVLPMGVKCDHYSHCGELVMVP